MPLSNTPISREQDDGAAIGHVAQDHQSAILPATPASPRQRAQQIPAATRGLFIRYMDGGADRCISEGARLFGLKPRTARAIWERFCHMGESVARPRGGRRNVKLTEQHLHALSTWVSERPDVTLEVLWAKMEQELQTTVSTAAISAALTKIGFTFKLL
jgi:transposase